MTGPLLSLAGGVGLFLFGMMTMTGALRDLGSDRMRQLLAGFTRTPLSGAVTGALTTAAIQSSSATMVMTVGFVGAGLIAFPQAIGILYGASVGTTFTGWMILLLGFRLPLGTLALPLLFAASLAALMARGRVAQAGRGLAGFALIFIGLDMMQAAMAGAEGAVTPDDFPPATLAGRLALAGIGVAITMVTQSSSAGVAATLVLLSGRAIEFDQAAALVIGMHVGTTFTAFLAAIGGTRAVLQTAIANVIYHVASGVLALPLIDVFSALLRSSLLAGDGPLALVLFHTTFNIVGVAVMLPVTFAFARAVQRLVPERITATPASRLDKRLLADVDAALDVASDVLREMTEELFAALSAALRPKAPPGPLALAVARSTADLAQLQEFMARISVPEDRPAKLERLNALLHRLDHLRRLTYRCSQAARLRGAVREPRLRWPVRLFAGCLERLATEGGNVAELARRLARLEGRLGRMEARARHATLRHPPNQFGVTVAEVIRLADALRWLRRSTNHAARILHYQSLARAPGAPGAPTPAEVEPAPLDAPPAAPPPQA